MKLLDILNGPWAIMPDKLEEIQQVYITHLRGEKIDLKAIEARIGQPLQNKEQGYEVVNGVAVIPVEGVIAKKMNLLTRISGGASTELIGRDVRDALADPSVKAIVLRIDSPGGTIDGTQDLVNLIETSRAEKPIAAWTDGTMASAAYWIASAAERLYISNETAVVGSIGVIYRHVDISKSEEKQGLKTTEVVAGSYKNMASQYEPLSSEGRAYLQGIVDHYYSVFVSDVARLRATDIDRVLAQMADGRIFIGTSALNAGLVDGVATLDQLIESLTTPAGVAGIPTRKEVATMEITTVEALTEAFPALVARIRQTAYDEGCAHAEADARTFTQERETAILALAGAFFGADGEVFTRLVSSGVTAEQYAAIAATGRLRANHDPEAAKRAELLAAITAAGAENPGAGADTARSPEERRKAEWEHNPDLRAEFRTFERYQAYTKAHASGHVRILTRKDESGGEA